MTRKGKKRFWAKVLAFMLIASMMVGSMTTSSLAAAMDVVDTEENVEEAVTPVVEEPKADAPEEETLKVDVPVVEESKADTPEEETQKVDVPVVEEPKTDMPKEEASKAESTDSEETLPLESDKLEDRDKVVVVTYATLEEFLSAVEAVGETDELEGLLAAIDNCLSIYNRLSPEDQEAQREAYEYIISYREELVAGNPDGEIETLAESDKRVRLYVTTDKYGDDGITGVKVKVGDTVKGHNGTNYEVVEVYTSRKWGYLYPIVVKVKNANNNTNFYFPRITDLWEVKEGYKVTNVNWTGNNDGDKSELGFGMLGNGGVNSYAGTACYRLTVPKQYNYTLTYNANGGSGAPAAVSKKNTTDTFWTPTLSTVIPTRADYVFKGWATSSTATTANVRAYTNGVWGAIDQSTITLTTTSQSKTIYAVWEKLPDLPIDNGDGISITKRTVVAPGNSSDGPKAVNVGDTIYWIITVKNLSNVEKTVALTEYLPNTAFVKNDGSAESDTFTIKSGFSKYVYAKHVVTEEDYENAKGGLLFNTVQATTGEPGDKENPKATDGGTEIRKQEEDTYTVIYRDSAEYGGTVFAKHTGLNAGDPTPGVENDDMTKWFAGKDKDFKMWAPTWQPIVGGTEKTIIYTALYKGGREQYPLTIYYRWAIKGQLVHQHNYNAAPEYHHPVDLYRGETYDVISPEANPSVPFAYTIDRPEIAGMVGYASEDIEHWVTYTPVVKINHVYRENGKVVGEVLDTTTVGVPFGGTITMPGYGITTKPSYNGKSYAYTSADTVTLPSEPSQLTKQPVLNLYYDLAETHNVIVHYKWAGTDVTAAADKVVLVERGKFYTVTSPTTIGTAPFLNQIVDNRKMTIFGTMETEDVEETVYYAPQYRMMYILQENGETKYSGYYQGSNPGEFGRSYTIQNYIGTPFNPTDAVWGQYLCTEVTPAVFPANPADLKATPVITLYFNKTIPTTLTVTKTANKTEVNPGDTVEYTITVENTGTVVAKDVEVTDILDANLEFDSATITGNGNVYAIGDIPAGETRTLTITARVKDTAAAGTEINNTATANYTNKPEDTPDPSDTVDVTVVETPVETVIITLRYVYVDGDGNETELQEKAEVQVNKGEDYDVNDRIPETITKDGQSYEKNTVDGELIGTAEEDKTVTVTYVLGETEEPDPTPTPAPTPTPTPGPTPPTPTPGPTPPAPTPTPAAVVPIAPTVIPTVTPAAAQPEVEPAEDIEDAQTPLAEEEVPLANEEVVLDEEEVPLAAGNGRKWALINFALMNLAIFESIMLLIGYFVKTKNDKDEEEEEEKRKLKKKGIIRILSTPVAVISLIAFILTEDITLPTGFVDKYTILMAIIAVVQTVMVALSNKKYQKEEEEAEA